MEPEALGLHKWKVQRDYANCTLLSKIMSGKIKDSQVSNPRIAEWTPALVNHGVSFKTAPQESVGPNGLLVEGEVHTSPFSKVEKVSWSAKRSESQEKAVKRVLLSATQMGSPFMTKVLPKQDTKQLCPRW